MQREESRDGRELFEDRKISVKKRTNFRLFIGLAPFFWAFLRGAKYE